MKKIILITLILTNSCFAQTCPSVSILKTSQFSGWNCVTIDDGTLATSHEINSFINELDHFALAEWMEEAPEGQAHCYYYNKDNRFLKLFLTQFNLIPDNQSAKWKKVASGVMQCYEADCSFK